MQHSFDVDIAVEYGVNCAILLNHIWFWCEKNKANEKHFYNDHYWTYSSVKALEELFPYMSKNSITRSLTKLKENDLLIEGNYNKSAYDRTKWYALTQKANSILSKEEIHLPKSRNGSTQSQKPIPDNITDKEHIEETYISNIGSGKRFVPPTVEEVYEYCAEKGLMYVNPDAFVEFYASKGWMVGKNKMTSWKMSVSGWNRRAIERGEKPYKPQRKQKHATEPEEHELTEAEQMQLFDEFYGAE